MITGQLPAGALLVGPNEVAALEALRQVAARNPVDMTTLMRRLKTRQGEQRHRRQMTRQSVEIPVGYMVTFSIETGHPGGTMRHMSMSSPREGRVPLPEAIWMVAEHLGFHGAIEQCAVWLEDLQGHGKAVNVVQLIATTAESRA